MKPLWWMRGSLREEQKDPDVSGGGGGAPGFDPVKLREEIMADIKKLLAKRDPEPEPKPKPEPEPEPKPDDKSKDPLAAKLERELASLRKDLDAERKARGEATEAARKEKRTRTLTSELSNLGVPSDRMKSAIRALDPDIKWADEDLVGEDDSPLSEYLGKWIKDNEHFLPPRQVGGSGASGGGIPGRKQPPVDLNDIKPGMSADAKAQIMAAIRAANPFG